MGNCIPCSASETTQATISVNHRSTNTKPSSTTGTSIGTSNAVGISDLKVYTYSDLKKCTRGFKSDMVLSVGWFGTVYKGWVDEKTLLPSKKWTGFTVAVKKLNHESVQGFQEWQSEVNFLGRLSHPNVVKLLGYCREDRDLLLVYEFMKKGSLENHLYGRGSAVQPLSWNLRLKIAIGAAQGLAFLHSSYDNVIYRDIKASNIFIKASNILLDRNYNAKISDFGLAKLGPPGRGSQGYAAPEYLATGHLYVQSDVYGFGVVLLELMMGLRALDPKRPGPQVNLVGWAKPLLPNRMKLKTIMDARMEGKYSSKGAIMLAQLILRCLEEEPRKRSAMKEVADILEQIYAIKVKT
ncbi:putative transferase, protein kinase RLK-Pelle-RLCK-VIIa-2 family [Helianthus annuus]|uniref:non-specific serine/threonine protein kinase n=1 Tax=Helianthus annuus TaxID=4232 RepID=A0A251T6X8_HELAN|nr:putative transferase, protein kinase RLK-Pelle-RLCK-VIIa-2 family [Helianthus annuus]KAJ0864427.1 putative transferase, protein kinase RLK-Pelle-RLCK-VIIa-2 family [Helianthus annuus]KAJ0868349.1 putative transferase, protein kinase RLK-Pelle-RLCK-VIIa-2 family [Helianthus annuus]